GPGEAARPDASSVHDPFVGGLHEGLEVRVGYDPGGKRRAERGEGRVSMRSHGELLGVGSGRRGASSSQTRGCPGATGSPSRTRIPDTLASTGERTSISAEPCSITATVCPASTHSTPSTKWTG